MYVCWETYLLVDMDIIDQAGDVQLVEGLYVGEDDGVADAAGGVWHA